MRDDAAFQEWIDRAKAAPIDEVASSLGAKLKRAGHELAGHCPAGCTTHGDGFSVHPKKGVFLCRPGGAQGSVIDLVMHINGGDFMQACEFINGEPPPRGESRPVDHDAARDREKDRKEIARIREDEHNREQAKKRSAAEQWFEAGAPIEGTHAMAYLRARGLDPSPARTFDLRFIESAKLYSGDVDPETGNPVLIGSYPCMVAAIRNVHGAIIGAHRTYLDPAKPRKLILPDGQKAGKKIIGEVSGGVIWLSDPMPTVACGEGIETTLAWSQLWTGGEVGLCAGVSLGNMAGGAKGTRPHPNPKLKRTIPNGEPDMSRPGMRLPPDVREIIILGDGDSDPATTCAHLQTAGRRFKAEGVNPLVSMAPAGQDWNDVLLASLREHAEAA
ncbi:MAG: CHC2 zinc finger domain-containing protein [Beijerinckiaceae bacterium]